jgi:hypothetical protein
VSNTRPTAETAKTKEAVLDCFKELRLGVFVRLSEFLAYCSDRKNPFLSAVQTHYFSFAGRSYYEPSADEIEEIWENVLRRFLGERLLPLGGIQIGPDSRGDLCLAVTAAGRTLLGAGKDDFELAADGNGQVLVQPNFDVVFLAPSARAEAEMARFAQRAGHRVGTLFKITKQSIFNAAAAGLTLERVSATLREHCASGLPSNVAREIAGWFSQYRQIEQRPAELIQCPDEQTALRLLSAGRKHFTPLNPTTLELHGDKMPPALLKKLRVAGIFLRAPSQVPDEDDEDDDDVDEEL